MRLWTVQTYDVYETINNTGIYRCNPNLSSLLDEDEFVNAYEWISKEMKKRIGNPPTNVKFPIWAWYKFNGQHRRPDMRTFGMRVFEKSVLMEIEIPDNQVLLSDFDLWHLVLNDVFCCKEGIIYTDTTILSDFVQATFWELKKEQIKKVWVLKGFQRK